MAKGKSKEPAVEEPVAETERCPTCGGRKWLAFGSDDVPCGTCGATGVVSKTVAEEPPSSPPSDPDVDLAGSDSGDEPGVDDEEADDGDAEVTPAGDSRTASR